MAGGLPGRCAGAAREGLPWNPLRPPPGALSEEGAVALPSVLIAEILAFLFLFPTDVGPGKRPEGPAADPVRGGCPGPQRAVLGGSGSHVKSSVPPPPPFSLR